MVVPMAQNPYPCYGRGLVRRGGYWRVGRGAVGGGLWAGGWTTTTEVGLRRETVDGYHGMGPQLQISMGHGEEGPSKPA